MFRPSYLKEGPGIAKDAPEKTGAAWVGETFVREFWQLVKLNVLFLLCLSAGCDLWRGSSRYGALHGQYGA